ncbi:alpha/beta fold hydrolase [Maribacter arenosus]|uniref:Alpha/beta hydrolase n=1 Tax=Maribacter arenosus TaxID=1854708 RepID=A0ABR7VCN1_9FLAO|nr:alpha/beta hydrolase [Maribacter arenosus]MBD0851424.1 alpha/beta hydrolase [Maribacter arenosus]
MKTIINGEMKKCILLFCLFFAVINVQSQEKIVLTSDNVELYINVRGKGPACLYIHGGPGSGGYWLEKFMGDSLEKHFQMIYLDQRGVGRSSSPVDKNYSMDRIIKDFEEVRESMGIKQWLTLGHSVGGILQMGYATNNPKAISGMIFINCTLSYEDSFGKSWLPKAIELASDEVPAICLDTSVSLHERMLAIMPILQKKGVMWKLFFASEEDKDKINETYSNFDSWNSDYSENAMEVSDYWKDFSLLTSKIEQPVLFYYGTNDWAIGPEHYKRMAFPNILLWGSDLGHMPFLENKDDLMKAIRAFKNRYRSIY